MSTSSRFKIGAGRCTAWLTAVTLSLLAGWAIVAGSGAEARVGQGVHPIVLPGAIYTGNASCAGDECHSGPAKEQSGQIIGDEFTIWKGGDPHSVAFEEIEPDWEYTVDGKVMVVEDMAAKLNIEDPTTSAKCLSCHAIHAAEDKRGERFRLQDAVGCEACHGPGEKYLEPHVKEGWTAAERQKLGAEGLLKQYGLVDTSNVAVRANTCVACHLQIDKALIDAGHPKLQYDQYHYNTIRYRYWKYYDSNPDNDNDASPDVTHWVDPGGAPFSAKLWATGVAASLEASKVNLKAWGATAGDGSDAANLLALYESEMAIIKNHFGAETTDALANAQITAAQAKAAAQDLAKLAPDAKTAVKRWGIAQGIAALGDLNTTNAFWDPYNNAVAASADGGAAYVEAINQMVQAIP